MRKSRFGLGGRTKTILKSLLFFCGFFFSPLTEPRTEKPRYVANDLAHCPKTRKKEIRGLSRGSRCVMSAFGAKGACFEPTLAVRPPHSACQQTDEGAFHFHLKHWCQLCCFVHGTCTFVTSTQDISVLFVIFLSFIALFCILWLSLVILNVTLVLLLCRAQTLLFGK